MIKRSIFALALVLGLSTAAFAGNGNNGNNGNQSQSSGSYGVIGGFGAAAGGYDVTTGTGSGWGTSASDVGGGNGTTSGVVNNGWSKQYSTGYDHSAAGASTDLGLGYANTATEGNNTAYNFSKGSTGGYGTGTAQGAAGGDFSAEAHGSYVTNYQGAQGDIYGGFILGGFNAQGSYATHGYGND